MKLAKTSCDPGAIGVRKRERMQEQQRNISPGNMPGFFFALQGFAVLRLFSLCNFLRTISAQIAPFLTQETRTFGAMVFYPLPLYDMGK